MKFWGQETVFDQVEVIQVVAVQAVQGGTQTFADNGPGTTAGRYRPPRRRILGCGIVGRTRQDARWQPDHGVRKCRLPHLICATHFWTVVVVSLLRWCTYLQSFSRDEICLFKFLTAFLFALSQELQCCWCFRTHSSLVVTLSCPPTMSSLKITDHSFRYALPRLWNQLPDSFHQPRQSCLDSPPHSLVSSSLLSFYLCFLT